MGGREFDEIASLFRPLTRGAPEALDLLDDAAVIPSRAGFDLIITKDAIVAGVHALADTQPADLARKLLRTNLSDLAAKGAEPDGAFLAVAWPTGWMAADRAAFAAGLGQDLQAFGVRLFGGDTVVTPGPFQASLTLLGWAPAGTMVRRSGASPGDHVLVSGTIGDGVLGLAAARGEDTFSDEDRDWLAARYCRPEPRTPLAHSLRAMASAAADVSDGLIADAGHIATASRVGLDLALDQTPLSASGRRWLARQPDQEAALSRLVTGGDDYEVVCTVSADRLDDLLAAAAAVGVPLTPIGRVRAGEGVTITLDGAPVHIERAGWSHLE